MTIEIEYEAEKKLDLPYEKIIRDVIEEAMDYEGCPYEAEVSVVLTDNPSIQEINRECNTIGSKCSDLAIARDVVDLKAEVEKIREQVQNIE